MMKEVTSYTYKSQLLTDKADRKLGHLFDFGVELKIFLAQTGNKIGINSSQNSKWRLN